ncbi:type I-F CRISPR-associated endoribonuclease Cas6/Csy4 [Marinomonas sp. M1K-6]|uniref:Type I-F CRISPR-associated endoribonuclease Cas6/Csy4 n=1 Tax=Marinomonas profundi TaxID=2726122 RepID=A0A847R472_9GAMM|nr:type I-F CRISPR-associated endoribonuclease Cas6/Csy4 [Marinomonas profundi]NLQ18775.1 type I-F CRISPR-associated endoribonuclease Cas6/Csy4 [Marinomonas profundi]UDV02290.1 type I-F CRISPR-associated endoribonuclease Cas6/Csy4 [Marinomonas profundi]
MDYYLDITILEDPEFTKPILMNALFSKLHRALVEVSQNDIGVSFPNASKKSLGDKLRLHSSKERLEQLEALPWRRGLGDFTVVTKVTQVPSINKFCLVKRVHVQSNVERLRRRAMKRHSFSYQEAVERIPKEVEKQLELPFVRIKSKSTGDQQFPLFIQQTLSEAKEDTVSFSKYGLSSTSTLPWF